MESIIYCTYHTDLNWLIGSDHSFLKSCVNLHVFQTVNLESLWCMIIVGFKLIKRLTYWTAS